MFRALCSDCEGFIYVYNANSINFLQCVSSKLDHIVQITKQNIHCDGIMVIIHVLVMKLNKSLGTVIRFIYKNPQLGIIFTLSFYPTKYQIGMTLGTP